MKELHAYEPHTKLLTTGASMANHQGLTPRIPVMSFDYLICPVRTYFKSLVRDECLALARLMDVRASISAILQNDVDCGSALSRDTYGVD